MRSLILSVLIAAFLPIPAQKDRDGGQYTIAVDVDLALFNVTVTDNKGKNVAGLKAGDFQVYEENRLQDISLFRAEDFPASIGLIIDNSSSMHNKRADVTKAAIAFVEESNPEDEMFVLNFNEKVYLGLPKEMRFTSSPTQLKSALVQTPPPGRTALYDALAAGLEHLKEGTRDRKVLVVLSDGGDNASRWKLEDVIQFAQRSSATIFTIGIYDESDADRNPGVLRKIAETSGARAYFPKSLADLTGVWRDVAAGIRSQYTIGYRSTNTNRDGSFRKVKIIASRKGGRALRVKAREGYLLPADQSLPR